MFGIGFPELIIILVVALIVFGPKKLPELAKALGKGMAEFKKATTEIKESLDLNEDLQSVRKDIADSISNLDRLEVKGEAQKPVVETATFAGSAQGFDEVSAAAPVMKEGGEKREAEETRAYTHRSDEAIQTPRPQSEEGAEKPKLSAGAPEDHVRR